MLDASYKLNQDFVINLLENEQELGKDGEKVALKLGINTIMWKGKERKLNVKEIPTIFSGLCHVILPEDVNSDKGDRFPFEFVVKAQEDEKDTINEIKLQFSSSDSYLAIVWVGMNGITTQTFDMSLDRYSHIVAFYNEIENHYIKHCDEGNDSVYRNFAKKFVEHKQNFTCKNVCIPLYFEPIADTIKHNIPNCDKAEDYYCMYSPEVLNIIVPLASETLKVLFSKIKKFDNFVFQNILTILPSKSQWTRPS